MIHQLQLRALWLSIGWVLVGLVLYLSLTPSPPSIGTLPYIDKIEHLFAYSLLMGWFTQIFQIYRQQVFWAIGFCLMGISLEFIQGWGGHRYFEYADMAANTAGVILGWWLSRGWCIGWLIRVDQMISR